MKNEESQNKNNKSGQETKSLLQKEDTIEKTNASLVSTYIVGDSDCSFNDIVDGLSPNTSKELIKCWKDVARAMDLDEATIITQERRVLYETDCITDVYNALLIEWRSRNSSKATLHKLVNILKSVGLQKSADRLQQKYDDIFAASLSKQKRQNQHRFITYGILFLFIISSVALMILLLTVKSNPISYRDTIPALPKIYIPRELRLRTEITNYSLFHTPEFWEGLDILVFSGITGNELENLVEYGITTSITEVLSQKSIKYRYVTDLVMISEFYRLCEIRDSLSVHWIEFENMTNTFQWKMTCGNIEFIQKHARLATAVINQNFLTKRDFFYNDMSQVSVNGFVRQPIIVYGSSGTGKSTLLASIGNTVKESYNVTVVYTEFNEFVERIVKNNEHLSSLKFSIQKAIAHITCLSSACKNKLLSTISDSSIKLLLLLDAFDELPESHLQKAETILKEILTWNNTLFIITTRPNYLHRLENITHSLGFHCEPFTVEKQQQFLVQSWKYEHAYLITERLHKFAGVCINSVNSQLNEIENSFTGIALLTTLMAEVYKENATFYADPANYASEGEPRISNYSVYHLYDKFVSSRFNLVTTNHKKLESFHSLEAIKLLLPNITVDSTNLPLDKITIIGILEFGTDKTRLLRFMHASFVDFFAAQYTVTCDIENALCMQVCLEALRLGEETGFDAWPYIPKLLSNNFVHKLTTYFVDAMLESKQFNNKILNKIEPKEKFLFAFLQNNHYNLFETLHQILLNDTEEVITSRLMFHSVMFSEPRLVISVLDKFISQFNNTLIAKSQIVNLCFEGPLVDCLNLLQVAAIRGDFPIFKHLWKIFGIANMGKNIMHYIVGQSYVWIENSVQGKINIMEFLVHKLSGTYFDILDELGTRSGCTPMFSTFSSELVLSLILSGASPEITCSNYGTILHYLPRIETSPAQYHVILSTMYNNSQLLPNHLLYEYFDQTALENYITAYEPQRETLELFRKAHANFSIQRTDMPTLFSLAIREGKRTESLKLLMDYVPNWINSGIGNSSVFSYAVLHNHVSAAKLLLPYNPNFIKIRDNRGFTPLYSIINGDEYGDSFLFEATPMVNFLLENHANPNEPHGFVGTTPFLLALQSMPLSIIKTLVAAGADVGYKDRFGNSSLHYALTRIPYSLAPQEVYPIVKYLHNLGVPLNSKNVDNLTALEQYVKVDGCPVGYDTIEFLTNQGAVTGTSLGNQLIEKIISDCSVLFYGYYCFDGYTGLNSDLKIKTALESLKRAGAYVNYRLPNNITFLHFAVQKNCLRAINSFIEFGLDVNSRDSFGRTALSYIVNNDTLSAEQGRLIREILLSYGAHL